MKLPRLSLRDLFWLVLVCAMGLGWWGDHNRLVDEYYPPPTYLLPGTPDGEVLQPTVTESELIFATIRFTLAATLAIVAVVAGIAYVIYRSPVRTRPAPPVA